MENLLHKPVMVKEVLNNCLSQERMLTCLDGTFGRGGHTKILLEYFPKVVIRAWDCDSEAIEFGKKYFESYTKEKRLNLEHTHWSVSCETLRAQEFDFVLLDLGVSSPQLDEAKRGFSFYKDGPLDMRMDKRQQIKAKDIVNSYSLDRLIEIFQKKGEIKGPKKIAYFLLEERKKKPFETTKELSCFIESIEGWRKKGFHPATQFFQAIRLEVNQELEELQKNLPLFFHSLKIGGRFVVISFHSLEDRIVKHFFRDKEREKKGFRVHKKIIRPTEEERTQNPRSRSAKMRVFEKGEKL